MERAPMQRVVVCDDEADVRSLLKVVVQMAGSDVVGEACDGLDGVRLASALRPDVVLLDLDMPMLDGASALPQILAAVPGVRVIVVSGQPARTAAARMLALGASAYIEKGDDIFDLVALLPALEIVA